MNDRQQVLAGMELMRWTYALGEWDALVSGFAASPWSPRPEQRRLFGASTIGGGLAAGAGGAAIGAGLWGVAGAAALAVPAAVAGAGAIAYLLGFAWSSNRGVDELREFDDPEIVLTSTGLIIDDSVLDPVARLWRGEEHWIANVWLFRRGPLMLEFIFNSARQPLERIKVPIPPALEDDVTELAGVPMAKVPQQTSDPHPPRIGPGPKVC